MPMDTMGTLRWMTPGSSRPPMKLLTQPDTSRRQGENSSPEMDSYQVTPQALRPAKLQKLILVKIEIVDFEHIEVLLPIGPEIAASTGAGLPPAQAHASIPPVVRLRHKAILRHGPGIFLIQHIAAIHLTRLLRLNRPNPYPDQPHERGTPCICDRQGVCCYLVSIC